MPLGINRTDLNETGINYEDGTPITEPHVFGTPVALPLNVGNPIPTSGTEQNDVSWAPTPAHFGNVFGPVTPGFILQADASSHILLADLSGALLVS